MTALRWGIIGPGRIAARLVRAVRAAPRAELVAVASRDPERARAFAAEHAVPLVHDSYRGLLESADVDVVYIALPNHLHAEWSVRALDAGKHVLCEKPLALSVDEVDAIQDAARRNRRIATEAFMYLHHPQILLALELARTGALGRVKLMNASFSFTLTHPGDPRADRAMGGGSLWDVGCYAVSFARRLAGEDHDALHAVARIDDAGIDRTFAGLLRFPGGLLATFDCGFAAPDRQRVEIVGSEAALTLPAPFLTEPYGPPPAILRWDGTTSSPIDVPAVDAYRLEVEDLTSAILDGTPPRVELGFSRGTIAALVALDSAARRAPVAMAS